MRASHSIIHLSPTQSTVMADRASPLKIHDPEIYEIHPCNWKQEKIIASIERGQGLGVKDRGNKGKRKNDDLEKAIK